MAIGFTEEQAAQVLGKSVASLWRHCRQELANGKAKIDAKIGGTLIKRALQGDTACLIFYAKMQFGWSERQIHEHVGRGGGPIMYGSVQADADAFTQRVLALGARHLIDAKAREIAVEPIAALAAPPEPSEIN